MPRKAYENYGAAAALDQSPTFRAGRYPAQAQTEKNIPADVAAKLEIGPPDKLLDIGCGAGLILLPLAAMVAHATGIDHPACIARLQLELPRGNISLVPGYFPAVDLEARYSKIVAYSVLQYLADEDEAWTFLQAAIDRLEPQGRLLIGDLPNVDLARRFHESEAGRAFAPQWRRQVGDERPLALPADQTLVVTDTLLCRTIGRLRAAGLHAWLLPQGELPFGNTREDLLVMKP